MFLVFMRKMISAGVSSQFLFHFAGRVGLSSVVSEDGSASKLDFLKIGT